MQRKRRRGWKEKKLKKGRKGEEGERGGLQKCSLIYERQTPFLSSSFQHLFVKGKGGDRKGSFLPLSSPLSSPSPPSPPPSQDFEFNSATAASATAALAKTTVGKGWRGVERERKLLKIVLLAGGSPPGDSVRPVDAGRERPIQIPLSLSETLKKCLGFTFFGTSLMLMFLFCTYH